MYSPQDLIGCIEIAFSGEPFMAVMHLYCDESGKYRKNPVITISGVAASAGRLKEFSEEWESLLRSYELGDELHMSRVADRAQSCGPRMPAWQTYDERTEALKPFADCINRHCELGLIQAWDVKGYNRLSLEAKRRLGGSHDPYQLAFVRGLTGILQHIGESGRLSIVADDDDLTAWDSYIHYRAVAKALPEIAKQLVGITFAKSQYFSPLQAADMVAFLARKEAAARFYGKPNEFKSLTDYLATEPAPSVGIMRWFTMFADEQQLINFANAMEVSISA
jgi:hypothetical protein